MPTFQRIFGISLLATLLSSGLMLLPKYSLSQRISTVDITDSDHCIVGGSDWSCTRRQGKSYGLDKGAVVWQEIPANHFFHDSETPFRKWNPYIGTGFPIYYDGIHRMENPLILIRSFFPGEKMRDGLTWLRFFLWTFFITAALWSLGVRGPLLYFAAFGSSMLGPLQNFYDVVYLDVDLMAPAILSWVLFARQWTTRWIAASALSLGLWIGLQSFIQSQFVYSMVFGILAIVFSYFYGRKYLYGLASYGVGLLLLAAPYALRILGQFQNLVSTRTFGVVCNADKGVQIQESLLMGIQGLVKNPTYMTYFSIGGLILVGTYARKDKVIGLLLACWALLFTIISFGHPSLICWVPGINGIHVHRHLHPHVQAIFFVLLFAAWWTFIQSNLLPWKKIGLNLAIFLFCWLPFGRGEWINFEWLAGSYSKAPPLEQTSPPKGSYFENLQRHSLEEDRRHFSPDALIFPNTSAFLKVFDLRALNPFYPRSIFDLNVGLFKNWVEAPAPDRPDRFVGPAKNQENFDAALSRLLVMQRVSLLSFRDPHRWLPEDGVYSKKNCHVVAQHETQEFWLCDSVGAIGFFPRKVQSLSTNEEIILSMNANTPETLVDMAFLLRSNKDYFPATGQVQSIERHDDRVIYHLQVDSPGIFVYADAFYPGWKAKVNQAEVPILIANIGFKAVDLTVTGKVDLEFEFKP